MQEKTNLLQEVVIRTKAKNATEELDKRLSSGLFSSGNETIFDFVNEDQTSAQAYTNILDWLQGRVAGFSTVEQNGETLPLIRGTVAQVFLDEMPVEANTLNGLSVSDIAMIKVIKGVTIASRGGNGAIAIYTRRGGMNSKSNAPSLPNNILAGYRKQPLPFTPDYADENSKRTEDKREILFRRSLLYPDAKQKGEILFYNNDSAKSYRVTVTGFTADGRLVYADKIIQ
jgi:hypothetical protein